MGRGREMTVTTTVSIQQETARLKLYIICAVNIIPLNRNRNVFGYGSRGNKQSGVFKED